MVSSIDEREKIIYNKLKNAISKYVFSKIKCSNIDLILFVKWIKLLIHRKEASLYSYDKYDLEMLCKTYLGIDSHDELNNLTLWIKNHFLY